MTAHGVAGQAGTTYAAGAAPAPVPAAGPVTATAGVPAGPPTCAGVLATSPAPLEGTWGAAEVAPAAAGAARRGGPRWPWVTRA